MVPYDENSLKSDPEWANPVSDLNQVTLPYNKYGEYYPKLFFVNSGETVEIVINSDYPVGVLNHEVQNALELAFGPNNYTGPDFSEHLKSYNLNRIQGGFTTTLVYSAGEAGEYYFCIINDSTQNSKCQYTVSILK